MNFFEPHPLGPFKEHMEYKQNRFNYIKGCLDWDSFRLSCDSLATQTLKYASVGTLVSTQAIQLCRIRKVDWATHSRFSRRRDQGGGDGDLEPWRYNMGGGDITISPFTC